MRKRQHVRKRLRFVTRRQHSKLKQAFGFSRGNWSQSQLSWNLEGLQKKKKKKTQFEVFCSEYVTSAMAAKHATEQQDC